MIAVIMTFACSLSFLIAYLIVWKTPRMTLLNISTGWFDHINSCQNIFHSKIYHNLFVNAKVVASWFHYSEIDFILISLGSTHEYNEFQLTMCDLIAFTWYGQSQKYSEFSILSHDSMCHPWYLGSSMLSSLPVLSPGWRPDWTS